MNADRDLDAAWEMLDRGRPERARAIADRLVRAEPRWPDALLLLGACERALGNLQGALSLLQRAAAADPEWSTPVLWMAEIGAEEGDLERAAREARSAVDLADEGGDLCEAVALLAGLELDAGRTDAAREALAALPPEIPSAEERDVALEIAHLHLGAGQTREATRRFQALCDAHPEDADAWHGLGLAAEARGDEAEKRRAFLRVLALDRDQPPARRMTEARMAEEAEQALSELPPRARDLLRGVPILIADRPAEADVATGLDPRLLGLFVGQAYGDTSTVGGAPSLTQILLFRDNLERTAADRDELREQIRVTLLHETGHFFGMDEEDLDKVGLG